MTLAATYDPALSRIRLAGTFLSPAVTAVFERSTDSVTWTTVRGGGAVPVVAQNANADDYEFPVGVAITYRVRGLDAGGVELFSNTDTITQDLDQAWIKVPAAPFLNRPVIVADRSDITRPARRGLFPVVGRTLPVAVGDVASSIAYTVTLLTETLAEESDLDLLFASGEIVFLQLPATAQHIPGGYFSVGDTSRRPATTRLSARRSWEVPLVEVAAPGPEVIGSTYTWTSVLADYATWADVLADNATWAELLERVGSPEDVIVP
jgi:hypothetical protein